MSSEKKLKNWLLFFIKALPLLFLIITAIYSNRHEIYTNTATYTYVSGSENNIEEETTKTATNYLEGIYYGTLSSFNKVFNCRTVININDFYLWGCNTLFNQNPPVMWETMFNIFFYEFFLDIIMVMYYALDYIVHFARRFLEGFYEKY